MWFKGESKNEEWLSLNAVLMDWPGAPSCTNANSTYQDLKGDKHAQSYRPWQSQGAITI